MGTWQQRRALGAPGWEERFEFHPFPYLKNGDTVRAVLTGWSWAFRKSPPETW